MWAIMATNLATVTLAMLVAKFVQYARQVQTLRFALGDVVLKMREVEPNRSVILQALRDALPEAKAMLGYAITAATLDNLATMAAAFSESGGLVSPDGQHSLTRADIESLGLTPAQGAALTVSLQSGAVKIKPIAKAVRTITKNPRSPSAAKAKDRVLAIAAKGSDASPSTKNMLQLSEELESIDKRVAELQERRARVVAAMKALQAEGKAAPKAAAPAPTVVKSVKRDRSKSAPTLTA
jgi:hypothetical protein